MAGKRTLEKGKLKKTHVARFEFKKIRRRDSEISENWGIERKLGKIQSDLGI